MGQWGVRSREGSSVSFLLNFGGWMLPNSLSPRIRARATTRCEVPGPSLWVSLF